MGGGVASGVCVAVGRGVAAVVAVVVGVVASRGLGVEGVGDGVVTGGAERVDVALSPVGEGEGLWTASGRVAGVVVGGGRSSVGGTAPGAGSPQAKRAITTLKKSPKVAAGTTKHNRVNSGPHSPVNVKGSCLYVQGAAIIA